MDITIPPQNFDEASYLAAHPDVADAVRKGQIASGWAHALRFGYREGRSAIPTDVAAQIEAFWRDVASGKVERVPPEALRVRVHGGADLASFYLTGATIEGDIERTLAQMSIAVGEHAKVLDFGCGCGRVLRHVAGKHPGWALFGSDIDGETIGWCRDHIAQTAEFSQNPEWPPSAYPDDFFDLVYSISIFTHLPEDMQAAWLEELKRITKPSGILLLSIHNINLAPEGLRENEDFLYCGGGPTDGLPEFYQTTFHPHSYVRKFWNRYLQIESILERQINGHQDLVVCVKRSGGA